MLLVLIVAISLSIASPLHAQQNSARYALVIGNWNYTELGYLKNPRNDAEDMAAALKDLGFDVTTLLDASLVTMEESIERLEEKLSSSSEAIGLFYYAGHGVQSEGINYLIPSCRGSSYSPSRVMVIPRGYRHSYTTLRNSCQAAGSEI